MLQAGRPFFPRPSPAPMLDALKAKLQAEAEKLRYELNVTLPAEIRRAVEMGDLRENSEYKAALERQRLVQARLGQLGERLAKLSNVDLKQIPTDRVGLGSRVVVLDLQMDFTETYHLVIGEGDEFDDGHVTMSSPIGRSLVDKGVGDEVILRLPAKTRRLRIVELVTIHEIP
jgi:transcription elongation factor GreA